MIDRVRRHEYLMLKKHKIRPNIGKYVKTTTQSCHLHDSNLVNTELSRFLRLLDLTEPCPFTKLPALASIRGNKSTESFSYNAVRFLAGAFKKSKDWRAYMLSEYGDDGGIPPIKSARFWSTMRTGGDYFYKRLDFLEVFDSLKDHTDLQVGGTISEVKERFQLFEFDCLMMAVDWAGFHGPWNKKASRCEEAGTNAEFEAATADTAKYVKDQVDLHRRCITSKTARDEYWLKYAKPAFIDRKLFHWAATEYAESHEEPQRRKAPAQSVLDAQKVQFEREFDAADVRVPQSCVKRQICMHTAIVDKITEFLKETAASGVAHAAAEVSGAPTSNIPVEDIFNFSRRWHDRHCTTRVGIIEAARRVRRAPDLGGEPISLENPPSWYPAWLKRSLKQRARRRIREAWLSARQRAHLRWQKTKELSQQAAARKQATGDKDEQKEERVRTMEGGVVGSGEEEERLPPLALLDLATFASIDFKKAKSWRVAEIQNQICLRNLQKGKRSDALTKLLIEKNLIKGEGAALIEGGSKSVLIKRLESVVKIEERARVLSHGQRELEAKDALQRAQDERREALNRVRRAPAHLRNGDFE